MKIFLLLFFVFINQNEIESEHEKLNEKLLQLNEFVHGGSVDYGKIISHRLFREISQLYMSEITVDDIPEEELSVFWVNAYNFAILRSVSANLPFERLSDIHGGGLFLARLLGSDFFKTSSLIIDGAEYSPHQIHRNHLVDINDARVAFLLLYPTKDAVIDSELFYALDKYEERADFHLKRIINTPELIKVEPASKQIIMSRHFSYYSDILPELNVEKTILILENVDLDTVMLQELRKQRRIPPAQEQFSRTYGMAPVNWKFRYNRSDDRLNAL